MNPAQKLENCQFADLIWDFFWGAYILSLCEKQANVFKLFKDIYHAPSFIVVQVHLLTQRTTPLASIDKLTSQLVAENDVVGAAAPFLSATSENFWLRNRIENNQICEISNSPIVERPTPTLTCSISAAHSDGSNHMCTIQSNLHCMLAQLSEWLLHLLWRKWMPSPDNLWQ